MATSKAKPTDATGKVREKLLQENAEAVQESANQMAMATAQKAVALETEVIDATKPNRAEVIVDEPTIVSAADETVTIRVVEDIESMTFGAGNFYSFRAGQKYQVERDLALHLKDKGYLANTI
jgi:hypothetical protein